MVGGLVARHRREIRKRIGSKHSTYMYEILGKNVYVFVFKNF